MWSDLKSYLGAQSGYLLEVLVFLLRLEAAKRRVQLVELGAGLARGEVAAQRGLCVGKNLFFDLAKYVVYKAGNLKSVIL